MKVILTVTAVFLTSASTTIEAFSIPMRISLKPAVSGKASTEMTETNVQKTMSASLFPQPRKDRFQAIKPISATISPPQEKITFSDEKGIFELKTKHGHFNPFGIFFGVTAIVLGLPWFVSLVACEMMYKYSKDFDKLRAVPVFFSHIWQVFLLTITRSMPKVVNGDILKEFYKEGRAGMIVSNHNSWMDIIFIGTTLGWRNYKFISKAELVKVPILGKAIELGGNVLVDRSSRRSQIQTLKSGMKTLKDGVHLCAFPEGTRSKDGRMLPFKNGAFKMAHKVGAPIIPMSIVGSGTAHPSNFPFPRMASRSFCKVVVHEPIESAGRTEEELAALVREKIIEGLPQDQKPLK